MPTPSRCSRASGSTRWQSSRPRSRTKSTCGARPATDSPRSARSPLVWGGSSLDARAAEVVRAFENRGLLLYENCQWPFALPAFERLHPGCARGAAAPLRDGAAARVARRDRARRLALPPAARCSQALLPAGAPAIEGFRSRARSGADPALTLQFHYRSGAGACAVEVLLRHSDELPAAPRSRSTAAAHCVWWPRIATGYLSPPPIEASRWTIPSPLWSQISSRACARRTRKTEAPEHVTSSSACGSSRSSPAPIPSRRPRDRGDPRLHRRSCGSPRCGGTSRLRTLAARAAPARGRGRPDPAPPPIAPLSINLDLTTACNYALRPLHRLGHPEHQAQARRRRRCAPR